MKSSCELARGPMSKSNETQRVFWSRRCLCRCVLTVVCSIVVVIVTNSTSKASMIFDPSIIFDNGIPDGAGFVPSDYDDSAPGGGYPFGQAADSFVLSSNSTIRSIEWWGEYWPDNTPTEPDDFVIRIWKITDGTPSGDPILDQHVGHVFREHSGIYSGPFDIYAYAVNTSPTELEAGTYLLSVVNNTSADEDEDDWFWAASCDAGYSWIRPDDTSSWINSGSELAFNGRDAYIPEPTSVMLLIEIGGLLLLCKSWLGYKFIVGHRANR